MQNYQTITGDISPVILTKNIAKSHLHNLKLIERIKHSDSISTFRNELESRELKSLKKLKEQCERYVYRVEYALNSLTIVHREIVVEEFFQNRHGHIYHHFSKSSFYRYRKAACHLFVEAFNRSDYEYKIQ